MKSTKTKYYNIPIFVPEESCPFVCIYCNQKKISGTKATPTPTETIDIIEQHLKTLPKNDKNNIISIGFFGGNFTGIDFSLQKQYLNIANSYLKKNQISGIRLSTRPDYIDKEKLSFLKENNVTDIELGVQSTDDEVLRLSQRGYKASQVFRASKLIKEYGFTLGLQMMIGLPGDNYEKAIQTAKDIVTAGALETRIYPLLIIKDTDIDRMYKQGKYIPLSIEETINTCSELVKIFQKANVKILRLGLHPSEDLTLERDLIAGPFLPALKQMVLSKIWLDNLTPLLRQNNKNKTLELEIAPKEANYAAGYDGINKQKILKVFKTIKFIKNPDLETFQYIPHIR